MNNDNYLSNEKGNVGLNILLIIIIILMVALISLLVYTNFIKENKCDVPKTEEKEEIKDDNIKIPDSYLPVNANVVNYTNNNEDYYEEVNLVLFDNNEVYISDNDDVKNYGYIGYYVEKDSYYELHLLYKHSSDVLVTNLENEKILLLYKDDSNIVHYTSTAGLDENIKLSSGTIGSELLDTIKSLVLFKE